MTDRWFEAFRGDHVQAVADLFTGRAGGGSNLRLEVPELLYQAFPPHRADERALLDGALLSWLLGMRQDYGAQVKRLGFSVYGKRVGDALIALQLLELPEAKRRVRADLDPWLRWLMPLRLAPERDPTLECLRLLTRGQPDASHTALWLRLAADPRPEYLTVALAGLQLLPNQDNAKTNQMLMLQALLRHAVKIRHQASAARTFNRRFAALRGLFPRGPQHWNRVLSGALDGFLEHPQDQVATELAATLQTTRLAQPHHSTRRRPPVLVPATREEWRSLEADILSSGQQSETLAPRLFELLERNHEYAAATGVSHFFVRTLHNLGTSLLETHQLGQPEMTRFGLMIERALVWEPTNPYCWMLWAHWFRAQGHQEAHEWTLREMLRLFPSNLHARVELGRLLIARGEQHWDEAEHWLRQAMERNPGGGHSRVVMARLLVLSHRRADAEALLAEFLKRHPDNPTARQSLDRLRDGTYFAADGTFDEGRENEIRKAIDRGGPLLPLPGALNELFRRGRLAGEFSRARIARARGRVAPTALDLIRDETRRGDPLAGFYSQWLMPDETPECPPHAWAWHACRHWQESAQPASWRRLAEQFPEAAPETDFLRVLAAPDDGHQSGAAGWHARYKSDGDTASRPVEACIREAQQRLVAAGSHERDELAVAVMACAAGDAVEFAPLRAA